MPCGNHHMGFVKDDRENKGFRWKRYTKGDGPGTRWADAGRGVSVSGQQAEASGAQRTLRAALRTLEVTQKTSHGRDLWDAGCWL